MIKLSSFAIVADKFAAFYQRRGPAGDHVCPDEFSMAKKLHETIKRKADLSDALASYIESGTPIDNIETQKECDEMVTSAKDKDVAADVLPAKEPRHWFKLSKIQRYRCHNETNRGEDPSKSSFN